MSARRQMYILHCLSKTKKTHDINIFQVLSRGIRDGYHTAKVTFISDHKVDSDGLDGEWENFYAVVVVTVTRIGDLLAIVGSKDK